MNKKNIKILLIIPALIILGLVWKYWYDYYSISSEEQEKIKIDEYNFQQLEKVKEVLDPLDKNLYSFDNIWDFNKLYNLNIEPIKNCYYLTDRNWFFKNNKWGWWYIFWFELESKKYIEKYWDKYYAYPEYDLPEDKICTWKCYDNNYKNFTRIISNTCNENYLKMLSNSKNYK